METIGFVGLGLLGGAMARRLSDCGFHVNGFDIDRARCAEIADCGVTIAANARMVFTAAERVLVCLRTSDVVERVLSESESAIRAGQIIIDATTGDPSSTSRIADRVASLGASYLDASVAGSSELARRGEIVMLVGGDAEAMSACADLFEALCRKAFHVGPSGAGSKLKLVHNLLLGLHRAALAEAICFAEALGLDAKRILAILKETVAYSKVMDIKGDKMIAREFQPQATLSQHLKDVRLMIAEAERTSQSLPLTQLHCQLLEQAEARGLGGLDNSAIIRIFEESQENT